MGYQWGGEPSEIRFRVLFNRFDNTETDGVDKVAYYVLIHSGATFWGLFRMLQKIGVLSFSEPFWLESIFDFPYRDDAFNAKVSVLQEVSLRVH